MGANIMTRARSVAPSRSSPRILSKPACRGTRQRPAERSSQIPVFAPGPRLHRTLDRGAADLPSPCQRDRPPRRGAPASTGIGSRMCSLRRVPCRSRFPPCHRNDKVECGPGSGGGMPITPRNGRHLDGMPVLIAPGHYNRSIPKTWTTPALMPYLALSSLCGSARYPGSRG